MKRRVRMLVMAGLLAGLPAQAGEVPCPQINAKCVVVWSGDDGAHYQIYRWDHKTATPVIISNNSLQNYAPQINAKGRVVWDVWDEAQWLVYLDGVQIWP